jgi:hypothetical protein
LPIEPLVVVVVVVVVLVLQLPGLEFVQVCGSVKSRVALEVEAEQVEAEEEQCCLPWS